MGCESRGCWAHNRPALECEACRGEVVSEELIEGVAFRQARLCAMVERGPSA